MVQSEGYEKLEIFGIYLKCANGNENTFACSFAVDDGDSDDLYNCTC